MDRNVHLVRSVHNGRVYLNVPTGKLQFTPLIRHAINFTCVCAVCGYICIFHLHDHFNSPDNDNDHKWLPFSNVSQILQVSLNELFEEHTKAQRLLTYNSYWLHHEKLSELKLFTESVSSVYRFLRKSYFACGDFQEAVFMFICGNKLMLEC